MCLQSVISFAIDRERLSSRGSFIDGKMRLVSISSYDEGES